MDGGNPGLPRSLLRHLRSIVDAGGVVVAVRVRTRPHASWALCPDSASPRRHPDEWVERSDDSADERLPPLVQRPPPRTRPPHRHDLSPGSVASSDRPVPLCRRSQCRDEEMGSDASQESCALYGYGGAHNSRRSFDRETHYPSTDGSETDDIKTDVLFPPSHVYYGSQRRKSESSTPGTDASSRGQQLRRPPIVEPPHDTRLADLIRYRRENNIRTLEPTLNAPKIKTPFQVYHDSDDSQDALIDGYTNTSELFPPAHVRENAHGPFLSLSNSVAAASRPSSSSSSVRGARLSTSTNDASSSSASVARRRRRREAPLFALTP